MKLKHIKFWLIIFISHHTHAHKMLVFSIPKCGTHLVAKSLELLTKSKLQREFKAEHFINNPIPAIIDERFFYRCHMPYLNSIEKELMAKNYKAFFIYRDPRDQVVSRAYWIQDRSNDKTLKIPNLIDSLIEDIDSYYGHFIRWKNSKNICTLVFENLVGVQGGGNAELQKTEIKKICRYLNINSETLVNYCINNLYGGTFTFREGKIGSWKTHFTQKQKNRFKQKAGNLLIRLGYEKNLNW